MEKRSKPLTFEKGLSREFATEAVPGSAALLSNWEPFPDGGLVTRPMWEESADSLVALQKIRTIAALPVLAGWRTPIRRQRRKRSKKGTSVDDITTFWWDPTMEGSLLVAILSYAGDATATITVTASGWTPVAAIHHGDSNISMRAFIIENAAEREEEEVFEFSDPVRRVQLEIMEWRGIKNTSPLDVDVVASTTESFVDTDADTDTTDPAFPTQLIIGAGAILAVDDSVKPVEFSEGFYQFTDTEDPPHSSTGKDDYWLQQVVARKVITESETVRFYAAYDSVTEDEDDIVGNGVAMALSFKAKLRSATEDTDFLVTARQIDTSTHGLQSIDLDEVDTGDWTDVGTLDARSDLAEKHPLSMTTGPDGLLISSRDVMKTAVATHRGMMQWDGDDLLRINRSPRATVVHFHPQHHRFYAGGTAEHPQRLYWSNFGDATFWPLDENFADIGTNGEYILDINSVNEGMLVAKRHSLHVVLGHGEPQSILQLAGGNGMPGRCICPIPGGAIVVGTHHIWLYQGGAPKLISRALDDWWANADHPFTNTAYVNGRVFIAGAKENSVVVYDTESGVWWVDTPPEPMRVLYSWDGHRVFAGPENNSSNRPVYFRDLPGTARSLDVGGESFHARTQEIMLGSPGAPSTPRNLHVAYRKRNYQAGHEPVVVTPIYDGEAQTPREITEVHPVSGATLEDGAFRIRLDVGVKDKTAMHKVAYQFDYESGDNPTCFDIEYVELIHDVEELR